MQNGLLATLMQSLENGPLSTMMQSLYNFPLATLMQSMGMLLGKANQTPGLQAVFSTFQANTPQLLVEVNRNRAKTLGVSVDDIFNTLQTALGSQYVNDFIFQPTFRTFQSTFEQFYNPYSVRVSTIFVF